MQYTKENAINLPLLNQANKFAADYFLEINMAPDQFVILEKDYDKIFKVPQGDDFIYVKLYSFKRVAFKYLSNEDCLLASGKNAADWQWDFVKNRKHLETEKIILAVYCYQKLS